jgi:four helix bundle protein
MGSDGQNPESPARDILDRTFAFSVRAVRFCRALDAKPGVYRNLARQLLRSATSIGANVEEPQAGQSRADFLSKYAIALKEARETSYWLRLIQSTQEDSRCNLQPLLKEVQEISRILGAIIVSTRRVVSNSSR